jgi:hypothetical protein
MLFLEFVIIVCGLIEDSLKLFHSRFGVVGLLLSERGLLPQLVVAAEQVLEELLVIAWIVRKSQRHAHVIRNTRTLM